MEEENLVIMYIFSKFRRLCLRKPFRYRKLANLLAQLSLATDCEFNNLQGFLRHIIGATKQLRYKLHSEMEASRRFNSRKGRVKWIILMSRMQVGSYECGYYVMLHMLNIVSALILEMWDE